MTTGLIQLRRILLIAGLIVCLGPVSTGLAETFEEELERLLPTNVEPAVYDAADRRDPFISLLAGADTRNRIQGIAGMAIGEITLVGILELPDENKGIFEGTDGMSYLLGRGDPVFDGKVVEVRKSEVVFERELRDIQRRVKEKETIVVRLHQ